MRIQRQDIERGLRRMSLGEGDIVLLHSAMSSLGEVEGGAETVIDAFLDVLGNDGTLVVPTFGALGIVPETLKRRPGAVHSIHPKASVAAIGAAAEAICRDHWKADKAHGPNTPYTRIAEMGGYVCLLGVDQDRNTTLHTVEELLELPYLKTTAEVTFDTPDGPVSKSWTYFPGPHRGFIGLEPRLRESGKLRSARIGGAVVRLIRGSDLIDIVLQLGRKDPAFVLCDNPNCADCVRQRADLTRARLAREAFRVAAATSLAGSFADEIADNCLRCGIDAVEIDLLRGLPLTRLPPERLGQAVEIFRREGIEICALRLLSNGNSFTGVLEFAAQLQIPRIVAPLSSQATEQARAAAEKGVDIAFTNLGMDADCAVDILRCVAEAGQKARLVISPAAFAAAGENPFLSSFRRGLREFADQLDVEDGGFDGTPALPGKGNAEVKELISILRCRSFEGHLVLSGRNRAVADLRTAVAAFVALLDTM